MRQIFYFFIAVLGGLLLHQTGSITQKMGKGWEHLAGPTIGVQGTLPFFCMFLKLLGFDNKTILKAMMAFEVAFLCIGTGVAIGWTLDTVAGIDRGHVDAQDK